MPPDSRWIERLLDPTAYAHPTSGLSLIETHISWVVLTGTYAYKVKKPVCLGFLDFSTLERRRHFCLEELRLNQRLAPSIYLDVQPIVGTPSDPHLGLPGKPFEYAVRMRQFDTRALASQLAQDHALAPEIIDALAVSIASFHRMAAQAPTDSAWGSAETIWRAMQNNLAALRNAAQSDLERSEIGCLEIWARTQFLALSDAFGERQRKGFVRECHGDLHLGNLAVIDGEPVPFDCIEFNAELRWIDIVSEVAFLTMDLEAHGLRPLAYRFINAYEAFAGDYAGLKLWNFYRGYRALTRAKVAQLTAAGTRSAPLIERCARDYRRYMDWALSRVTTARPVLVITHGLSGSGKSTIAAQMAEQLGAIRLRSDVERKRLAEMPEPARYSEATTRQLYRRLALLAKDLLQSGISTVVDATFLRRDHRQQLSKLADRLGVRFWIADIDASEDVLRERIARRTAEALDPSEATLAVLARQIRQREPLTSEELPNRIPVDGRKPDIDALMAVIRQMD